MLWGLSVQTEYHGDRSSSREHPRTSLSFIDQLINYRKLYKIFKQTITTFYTCMNRTSEWYYSVDLDKGSLAWLSLHFSDKNKINY